MCIFEEGNRNKLKEELIKADRNFISLLCF